MQEAASFFKLGAGEVTVFQDELELPPAKVRVKVGGGIAGHNGLRSISVAYRQRLSPRAARDRPPRRQGTGAQLRAVRFRQGDRPWVEALCEAIADNAGLLATGRDSTFQNKVHLAMQAKGFFDKDDDGAA